MNSPGHDDDSLWLKQWRSFFYALIAVFVVWLVSNMSERKSYTETYRVVLFGVDTLDYAVVDCDSAVTLEVESNGFDALRRSVEDSRTLTIDVSDRLSIDEQGALSVTVDVEEVMEQLKEQLNMRGVTSVRNVNKQLSLSALPRERKAFVPEIESVNFEFEGMCGLCGDVKITPDTVWLYGSRASLDKLERISAEQQTIRHIFRSGHHKVHLKKEWQKYSDVRSSADEIDIYIPVETFTERSVKVAVRTDDGKGMGKVHLYPDEVTVFFTVPNKEYADVAKEDFEVTATLNSDSTILHPRAIRFPSNVRITRIEPPAVQFIVIK